LNLERNIFERNHSGESKGGMVEMNEGRGVRVYRSHVSVML